MNGLGALWLASARRVPCLAAVMQVTRRERTTAEEGACEDQHNEPAFIFGAILLGSTSPPLRALVAAVP
jgi:hypothetical protein